MWDQVNLILDSEPKVFTAPALHTKPLRIRILLERIQAVPLRTLLEPADLGERAEEKKAGQASEIEFEARGS
jgi:hypothetical protein